MARVLAVTSRLPFPPREGHQLRSWNLLRALATRHEVGGGTPGEVLADNQDQPHSVSTPDSPVEVTAMPPAWRSWRRVSQPPWLRRSCRSRWTSPTACATARSGTPPAT